MKVDLEMSLSHDGHQWIAHSQGVTATGGNFTELDSCLSHLLTTHSEFASYNQVAVFMGFDYDTLPTWLRQYAYHYFNRYVLLNLKDIGG